MATDTEVILLITTGKFMLLLYVEEPVRLSVNEAAFTSRVQVMLYCVRLSNVSRCPLLFCPSSVGTLRTDTEVTPHTTGKSFGVAIIAKLT